MMGGELNWAALPVVADILGFVDIELLIGYLNLIRDSKQEK